MYFALLVVNCIGIVFHSYRVLAVLSIYAILPLHPTRKYLKQYDVKKKKNMPDFRLKIQTDLFGFVYLSGMFS